MTGSFLFYPSPLLKPKEEALETVRAELELALLAFTDEWQRGSGYVATMVRISSRLSQRSERAGHCWGRAETALQGLIQYMDPRYAELFTKAVWVEFTLGAAFSAERGVYGEIRRHAASGRQFRRPDRPE